MIKDSVIKELLSNCDALYLLANDFFGVASSVEIELPAEDVEKYYSIIEKYHQDGINAIMAYIADAEPLQCYVTDDYKKAMEEIRYF